MKIPLSLLVVGLISIPALAGGAETPNRADAYPSKPVKVVVPYAAGAAADIIGRVVAQKLSELSGGQFYVENLPGAGGSIGTGAVARAAADGHTILIMNQHFVVQPWVKSEVPY